MLGERGEEIIGHLSKFDSMIEIFCSHITNRLQYSCQLVFRQVLDIPFRLVTNKKDLHDGIIINYSLDTIENSLQIIPHDLLHEDRLVNIRVDTANDILEDGIFQTGIGKANCYLFDVFAACFYLVSRYEEYLPAERDTHGRYLARNSLLYKQGVLQKPVINIWINAFKKEIIKKFGSSVPFGQKSFIHVPTIDVDVAYAYLYRDKYRNAGAKLKARVKGNKQLSSEREKVLAGDINDPFDQYEFLVNASKTSRPIFFLSVGKRARFDKNISYRSPGFKEMLSKIAACDLGLHPSYLSNKKPGMLAKEKARLEEVAGREILKSRQHYLKLDIPGTYRNLIVNNIREDYTMGYAEEVGFRAGIANPFPFYDVVNDVSTDLMIYPFQVMDGTLKQYMRLSPGEAGNKIKELIHQVKLVDGMFVSLWHNSSFSETHGWPGWKKVYLDMLDECN